MKAIIDTPKKSAVEWPTVGLILANYSLWLICLFTFTKLPMLSTVVMCLVLALQSSITHELIHGHPTRSVFVNMSLGILPLTLFYPIHLFREMHLKHHVDECLTLPGADPESFFYCPVKWSGKCRLARVVAWINMTLVGRLVFSVPAAFLQVMRYAWRDCHSGSWNQRGLWMLHFALIYLLLNFLTVTDSMPIAVYVVCAAVGHSIISLRAFYEHRPAQIPGHRIVIVTSNRFFRLLYLGNNLHAVHHKHPELPWYQISRRYAETSDSVLEENNRFYFSGYKQWLRYLFRPIHSPVHPGVPMPIIK